MSLQDDQREFYRNGGKSLSNAFTSFNELTVSNAKSLFDLKSIYGISELRDEIDVTGTGAVTNQDGLYTISSGSTAGSTASLTSVDRGRYVAGFEAVPGIAIALPRMPVGDEVARWGYFDENEGFGTGVDANGFFTFLRYGGVERTHRRELWSEKLSGLIDDGYIHIYRYPFRWYGSGPVRFEVSEQTNPLSPDLLTYDAFTPEVGESITKNSNLKIRAEVEGGDNFSIKVGGRQFFVQGNYNPIPRFSSEYRLAQSVGTSFVPLISCKQTTGILQAVSCKLEALSLLVSGASVIVQIRIGATVIEPIAEPNDIPSGESAMLWNTTDTTMTGGFKIWEGLVADGQGNSFSSMKEALPSLALPDNEIITLCARSFSGTATVNSVFSIKEEW